MTKQFWQSRPSQEPVQVELGDQTHYLRKVSPYDLGLVSAQCQAYCGVDVENMTGQPVVRQIKAMAYFTAFALCDESGVPYWDAGQDEKPLAEFVHQVEQMTRFDLELLTTLTQRFIEANTPHMDPELAARAKKNLSSTTLAAGSSGRPAGQASADANGSPSSRPKSTPSSEPSVSSSP